jgi:hypothetical protein
MVRVLTLGPRVHRFKSSRRVGFLRTIKIHSTPSFGGEVKPEAPCCKILRHIKKSHTGMDKNTLEGQNFKKKLKKFNT